MTAQFILNVVGHKLTFGAIRMSGARRSSNAIPSGYEREGNRKLLTLRCAPLNLAITGLLMAITAGKLRLFLRACLAHSDRPLLPQRPDFIHAHPHPAGATSHT